MSRFSNASQKRLATCHKDLQVLFNRVINTYDCTIVYGERGEQEQNEAYEKGFSQLRYPQSKHNKKPSWAVDAVPFEVSGPDWGKTQCAYFAGYVMGIAQQLLDDGDITHKVRCGIDWNMNNDVNDTKFWDACHFELVPNKGETI